MKLDEKGRFQPPPALPTHAQRVATELGSWPRVHARTHWFLGDETVVDGADFYLGDDELGHLHLDGMAHIPQAAAVAEALLAARLARPFRWGANWVQLPVTSARSVEQALWLFRLSYDRRRGVRVGDLVARVNARRDEGMSVRG